MAGCFYPKKYQLSFILTQHPVKVGIYILFATIMPKYMTLILLINLYYNIL
jgi:hypothetical protein